MIRITAIVPAIAVLAQPGPAFAAAAEPLSTGRIVEVFAGLAVVVALVFGLALLLRRMNVIRPAGNGRLRILESMALGTREKLVLVEVNGEQLLLGLSAGRIQALHVATAPGDTPAPDYDSVQRRASAALGLAGKQG